MPLRPCLDCRRLSHGSRCPDCTRTFNARREARRGTRQQRGLGADHDRQRRALIRQATADGDPLDVCPRCARDITAANPITGEHGTPRAHGGTELTALVCKHCNSSAGATIRRR